MSDAVPLKYRAFLSYSHADEKWAKWLHRGLETYRLDKDLIGAKTALGPVPKSLRPIFRDREDFSGGRGLTEATIAALDVSAALVVVCSTNSAGRPAVNEEARLFRSRHPDRPVIPVIVEGAWPENFPPALRYEVTTDGTITDEPITILGPDLRDGYGGKNLGLAKTVAGLTGLGTDDMVRRAERARKRRNQFWAALTGLFLLLAIAASGSALYAWQQLRTNEAFLEATLKQATEIVDEAVVQAEKFNVPRRATLAFLAKAEGLFEIMARYGRPTPELRYRQAWMLIEFARNYVILGDTKQQFARATEANRLLAGLVAEKPDDAAYQASLAAAHDKVGDVQVAQGDLKGALKSFSDSLAIFDRLAKSDPNNTGWKRDLSVSYEKVGDVQVAQGDLKAALKSFSDSLAIADRLAKSDPGNTGWQRDLAVSYGKLGSFHRENGDKAKASEYFGHARAILARLTELSPENATWKQHLAWLEAQIAEVEKVASKSKPKRR